MIFGAFLRANPEFAGEVIAKWEQPNDDPPDVLCTASSGRRIGVELGDIAWYSGDFGLQTNWQANWRRLRRNAQCFFGNEISIGHFVPCAAVEGTTSAALDNSTPVFEEERHLRVSAVIPQIPHPRLVCQCRNKTPAFLPVLTTATVASGGRLARVSC